MRKSRVLRIDKNIIICPFSIKYTVNIVKTFLCNSPLQSSIKLFSLVVLNVISLLYDRPNLYARLLPSDKFLAFIKNFFCLIHLAHSIL